VYGSAPAIQREPVEEAGVEQQARRGEPKSCGIVE
jgi:hypothetical protein